MTTQINMSKRYGIESAQAHHSTRWSGIPFNAPTSNEAKAQLSSWLSTFIGSAKAYKFKYESLQKCWMHKAYMHVVTKNNTGNDLDYYLNEEEKFPRNTNININNDNPPKELEQDTTTTNTEEGIVLPANLRAHKEDGIWHVDTETRKHLNLYSEKMNWNFSVPSIIDDHNTLVAENAKLIHELKVRPVFIMRHDDSAWVEPSYFKRLGIYMKAGRTIALVGPAGTGKTTAAIAAAKALGFVPYEADITHHTLPEHLVGRVGFNGKEDIFRPGICALALNDPKGCIILNEWDAANPTTAMALQSLFERRTPKTLSAMDSKDIRIQAQGECPIILTMNTLGDGPNRQYVGRNRLDYATMDRISIINCDYENEDAILKGRQYSNTTVITVTKWAQSMRQKINSKNMPVVLSTRRLLDIAEAMENFGMGFSEAVDIEFMARLQPDDVKILRGN